MQERKPLAGRAYHRCNNCHLIFVPAQFHLSPHAEKAVYDLHNNDPNDPHYRKFLSKTTQPLIALLEKGARGLDFGSGPGPTLSLMMQEADFACENYDLYYANNPGVFNSRYDFITSTEVVEHLAEPFDVLNLLDSILKPDGFLAIMTKRPTTVEEFSRWGYPLDPTHITFYPIESFHWIAKHFDLKIVYIGDDVVIFKKDTDAE